MEFKISDTEDTSFRNLFKVTGTSYISGRHSYGYTESLTSSESISLGMAMAFYDSASVSDIIAGVTAARDLGIDSATALDLVGVADGLTYSMAKTFSDAILVTDSVGRIGFSVPDQSDSTGTSDTYPIFGYGKGFTDSSIATESFSRVVTFNLEKGDIALGLDSSNFYDSARDTTDTVNIVVGYNRGFSDSTGITSDNVLVSQGWVRILADSTNPTTDVFTQVISQTLALSVDSAVATDPTFIISPNPIKSDATGTSTDLVSLLIAYQRNFEDSAAPTESLAFNVGSTFVDSAAPVESLIWDWNYNVAADSTNPTTDVFTRDVSYNHVFTDAVTATIEVLIGDGIAYQATKVFTDAVTATEAMARSSTNDVSIPAADQTTPTDAIALNQGRQLTADSAGTSDSASAFMQDYFAEDFVLATDRYVEKAYYSSI